LADELEWARADGVARKIGRRVSGNDAGGVGNEVDEKRSVRLLEMKNNGLRIGSFNVVDHAEGAALGRFVGGVEDEIESGFYVSRGERATVVEFDVGFEMKNVRERTGHFPRRREVAVEIHLGVAREQAGEDEAVEALRLAVGGEARVEVYGIGFDEEGEVARIEGC